jgi:cephalosporin-C deacetylase-like acetyl esterase
VLTDLPLDQLRAYRPERDEPADLDAFWARTHNEHDGGGDHHVARRLAFVRDLTGAP